MKLTGTLLGTCLLASISLAAKLPTTSVRGEYLEARTADVYTGPCFANGEVGQTGKLAVMGWHIDKGSWQGVSLDGLSVMGVLRASNTLGDFASEPYPVKSVIIVDQTASPEQQMALKEFAQRMGGELLADVVRVEVEPMQFNMKDNSIHSMTASLTAGQLAKVSTRPLTPNDQICHNEGVWYQPLVKVDHAMAAYTTGNSFEGKELGENWNYPEKRGSFIATFSYQD
jgi:hypothetical protein